MQIIKSAALALAFSTTATYTVFSPAASAQESPGTVNEEIALERDQFNAPAPNQENLLIYGQIQSIEDDGERAVVRTNDGTVRTYEVTRGTVEALKLAPGANIAINPFAIRTGYLRNISSYQERVELTRSTDPRIRDASGGVETFYLAVPTQRHLFTAGNKVAIWSTGEIEKLSERVDGLLDVQNVRVIYPTPVVAQSQVEQRTVQLPQAPPGQVVVPPAPAPAPPVRVLW